MEAQASFGIKCKTEKVLQNHHNQIAWLGFTNHKVSKCVGAKQEARGPAGSHDE